jgi:hypothetical protein
MSKVRYSSKNYLNIKFETLCDVFNHGFASSFHTAAHLSTVSVDTGEDAMVYVISFAKIFPLLSD